MSGNSVFDRIQQEVTDNPVVLYMKGTPMFPQCGFSAAVVKILSDTGVKFKGVDVLTDPSLREGIKAFANWPTIPQLYVKGESSAAATSCAKWPPMANSAPFSRKRRAGLSRHAFGLGAPPM